MFNTFRLDPRSLRRVRARTPAYVKTQPAGHPDDQRVGQEPPLAEPVAGPAAETPALPDGPEGPPAGPLVAEPEAETLALPDGPGQSNGTPDRPVTPPPILQRDHSKKYLRTPHRRFILSCGGVLTQRAIQQEMKKRGVIVSQPTISRILQSGQPHHSKPGGRKPTLKEEEVREVIEAMRADRRPRPMTYKQAATELLKNRVSPTTLGRTLKRYDLCPDRRPRAAKNTQNPPS